MPRYSINMPFAGYFNIEVDAESEEQAFEQVYNTDIFDAGSGAEVMEMEYLKAITRGNVCYAPLNAAEITEIEDEE